MDKLRSKGVSKVNHDNTDDEYLKAARWYAFWLIHEKYDEYNNIKSEIIEEKNLAKRKIDSYPEDIQNKINEIVEIYLWKEETYGSSE